MYCAKNRSTICIQMTGRGQKSEFKFHRVQLCIHAIIFIKSSTYNFSKKMTAKYQLQDERLVTIFWCAFWLQYKKSL